MSVIETKAGTFPAADFSVLDRGERGGRLPTIPGGWDRKYAEYAARAGGDARSREQILGDIGLAPTYWSRFNRGAQPVWRHQAQHVADRIGCRVWELVQDPAAEIDDRLRGLNERRDAARAAQEALRGELAAFRLPLAEPDGGDGYERLVRDAAADDVSDRLVPPPEELSDLNAARLVREFRQILKRAAAEAAGRDPGDTAHDLGMEVRDFVQSVMRDAGLRVLVGRYAARTLDDEDWSVVPGDNVSLRKHLVVRVAAVGELDALLRGGLAVDRWTLHGEALAESYAEIHGDRYGRYMDGLVRWLGGPVAPSAAAVTRAEDAVDAYVRANCARGEG